MKITVLIENTTKNHLQNEHGLSFYIQFSNKTYLLDSGASFKFIANAKALGIDLDVDYVILSHGHNDHGGGFPFYLEKYNKKIYAMDSIFDTFVSSQDKHDISLPKTLSHKQFSFLQTMISLQEDVYLVPHQKPYINKKSQLYRYIQNEYIDDDFSHELSFVFDTKKGLIIFNSCSHAGVISIIEEIKNIFPDRKIHAYIGGLHLKGKNNTCPYSQNELKEIAIYLNNNVDILYTGHCTGDIAYHYLKEEMKEKIQPLYTGKQIEIEENL